MVKAEKVGSLNSKEFKVSSSRTIKETILIVEVKLNFKGLNKY